MGEGRDGGETPKGERLIFRAGGRFFTTTLTLPHRGGGSQFGGKLWYVRHFVEVSKKEKTLFAFDIKGFLS